MNSFSNCRLLLRLGFLPVFAVLHYRWCFWRLYFFFFGLTFHYLATSSSWEFQGSHSNDVLGICSMSSPGELTLESILSHQSVASEESQIISAVRSSTNGHLLWEDAMKSSSGLGFKQRSHITCNPALRHLPASTLSHLPLSMCVIILYTLIRSHFQVEVYSQKSLKDRL